jgi:hypothetical protein
MNVVSSNEGLAEEVCTVVELLIVPSASVASVQACFMQRVFDQ